MSPLSLKENGTSVNFIQKAMLSSWFFFVMNFPARTNSWEGNWCPEEGLTQAQMELNQDPSGNGWHSSKKSDLDSVRTPKPHSD